MQSLDQILSQRQSYLRKSGQVRSYLVSLLLHGLVIVGFWGLPKLFAEPPQEVQYVTVMVVPPAVLGIEQPPPPPPPVKAAPPETEPVKPPPPPEPKLKDVPVLKTEKKPEKKVPPPPAPVPATPPPQEDPNKRRGSVFGNPLGVTATKTTLGVEDPNFTYGYYLDRILAQISQNWLRPPVGGKIEQAVIYFRVQRDGRLTDLRLATASGSEIFDQAALRAVQASSPLPPLPKGYQRDFLGINLIVR